MNSLFNFIVPSKSYGILAICMLVFMHFLLPSLGGQGLELPNNLLILICLVTFIVVESWKIQNSQIIKFDSIAKLLILLTTITFVISLWHGMSDIYPGVTGYLLLFTCFYIVLRQTETTPKFFFILLIFISAAIEAVMGLLQMNGISVGIYALELSGQAGVIAQGVFMQPNVFSSYMLAGFSAGLCLLFTADWKLNKSIKFVIVLFNLLFVFLVLTSGSRTGWLSLILILLVFLIYLIQQKSWAKVIGILSFLLIPLTVLNFGVTEQVSVIDKVNTTIEKKVNSNFDHRKAIYRHTIDIIAEKPWLGYGFNNFIKEYRHQSATKYHRKIAEGKDYPMPYFGNLQHPHNELLYFFFGVGILPVLIILLICTKVIRIIIKKDIDNTILPIVIALPIAVHAMTELPLSYSLAHSIILIFALVLLANEEKQVDYSIHRVLSKFIFKPFSILLLLITIVFSLNSYYTTMTLFVFLKDYPKNKEFINYVFHPADNQDRYDFAIMSATYALASEGGIKKAQVSYARWALKEIQTKPRAGTYERLINCLILLNRHKDAQKVKMQAEFLFPTKIF